MEEKKGKVDSEKNKVKLKSEMYNHDNEHMERREEDNDAVMWGFVLGFILFFILLISDWFTTMWTTLCIFTYFFSTFRTFY